MNRSLDLEKVRRLLATERIGRELRYEQSVDSTNARLRAAAKQHAPEGLVWIAEQQTKGRGRRGRSWDTPGGTTLAFSMLLYPTVPAEDASMLTLLAGLAFAKVCEKKGAAVQLKWPNDGVLHQKKICGILTEMQLGIEAEGGYAVILGIGVNVNQSVEELPGDLLDRATSLKLETGRVWAREELLAELCNTFEELYRRFLTADSLQPFCTDYEKYLANRNKQVRIEEAGSAWEGTALGINERGELLVRTNGGGIRTVCAGEVSVRGLYGYVDQ